MKFDFIGGLIIVIMAVLVFSVGILIGNTNTERDAAKVGAGFFVANPTNGQTSFVWNTNTPAQ